MEESNALEKIDVLLVDDRKENLLSLEVALASPDYNLIKVNSGYEALRYLLDNTPALILLDVQMPELNGIETAAIIKKSERTREIPIIFVTAINPDEAVVHQGYDYGAVDYIYKPYDPHVLRAKVAVFAEIMRQHSRISRLVSVQEGATLALAESAEVAAAILKVLKSICISLRWDVGLFWRVDRKKNSIHCEYEWHDLNYSAPEFIAESFRTELSPGEGIPGRVWAGKKPLWIAKVAQEFHLPRLTIAAKESLRTAVAVPVFVQDDILGVLEFYSRNPLKQDPDLVKIIGAIGNQVGQVVKRTEAIEVARISEARKTAIVQTAIDCVISIDQDGRIIEFNPAAEATFGMKRANALGRSMAEVIFPEDLRDEFQHMLRIDDSGLSSSSLGRRTETRGVRSDRQQFPIEFSMTRVLAIEPPMFTCFVRDITDRKRNELNNAFLMEAGETLSASLDTEENFKSLANLVVRSLADWCTIEVFENGSGPKTVAVAHPDPLKLALAEKLRSKYPYDPDAKQGIAQVLRTGRSELYSNINDEMLERGTQNKEQLLWIKDLGLKAAMIVPLTARKKTFGAITLISTQEGRRYSKDDLAFAEELAARASISIDNARLYHEAQEAIKTRDEFFSIASHELKTPITALKMMIQLTQRGVKPAEGTVPSAEKLAKMLDTSTKQVDRLTHLVEDLLDVVKIRAGKLTFNQVPVSLGELVKEVADQFKGELATSKSTLELKLPPKDVVGLWDPNRIDQVLINLISNAIKYAPGAAIVITVSEHAGTAKIQVHDSGPGIPLEQRAKIFDRFERTIASRHITGLGLGLYIVKQIVEAHLGSVRLESEEGKGSNFIIELPTHAQINLKTGT